MKNLMNIAKLVAAVSVLALLAACNNEEANGGDFGDKEAGAQPTSSSSQELRQNISLGGGGGDQPGTASAEATE